MERHELATAVADKMVVVLRAVGVHRLVARQLVADLDATDDTELLELLEHAIDRRASDAPVGVLELALDVERRQRAALARKQLDDSASCTAATVAGVGQATHCMICPVVRSRRARHLPIVAARRS